MTKITTVLLALLWSQTVLSFSAPTNPKQSLQQQHHHHQCGHDASPAVVGSSRRDLFGSVTSAAVAVVAGSVTGTTVLQPVATANAAAAAVQDSLDIENFLRTGIDSGGIMGVSSQAGKSRPQTGVVLRDGSDVSQDRRSGSVAAEILTGTKANPQAVLISFSSPWKLETGPVFDVECRDGKTGDGAFVAVTRSTGGKPLSQLPDSFFLERLFDPTGRFSFYGPPTDIKVKKSFTENNQRIMELTFSNLSQSTNAEIPRRAVLTAGIPSGSDNAVMLVGSASASRWRKGADEAVWSTINSFRAVPAPKTNMKLRAKDRGAQSIDF